MSYSIRRITRRSNAGTFNANSTSVYGPAAHVASEGGPERRRPPRPAALERRTGKRIIELSLFTKSTGCCRSSRFQRSHPVDASAHADGDADCCPCFRRVFHSMLAETLRRAALRRLPRGHVALQLGQYDGRVGLACREVGVCRHQYLRRQRTPFRMADPGPCEFKQRGRRRVTAITDWSTASPYSLSTLQQCRTQQPKLPPGLVSCRLTA